MRINIALDSTPLIFLAKTDNLQLATAYFNPIMDNYVYEEVVSSGLKRGFRDAQLVKKLVDNGEIKLIDLKDIEPLASSLKLGLGETSTIMLVKKKFAEIAVIDDKYARNVAKSYGVRVCGTLSLLLTGVKKGLIGRKKAAEILAGMVQKGFRISPEVVAEFNRRIDEM